jgi:segregation and condensation protein B
MSLESKIESLLFISGRPMSDRELADLAETEVKDIAAAGEKLMAEYKERNNGVQIVKNGSSWQMVTSPDNAALIQKFIKDETTGELTRPSLETLTIIAYRGPIAKTDLDRIRGINCSLILRNLLIRGLVDVRDDRKKDESYYTVTFDFLRFLGLNEVKELPDYDKLSQDDTIDRILEDNPLAEKLSAKQPPLGLDADQPEPKDDICEEAGEEDGEAADDEEDELEDDEDEDEEDDEADEGDEDDEETAAADSCQSDDELSGEDE